MKVVRTRSVKKYSKAALRLSWEFLISEKMCMFFKMEFQGRIKKVHLSLFIGSKGLI